MSFKKLIKKLFILVLISGFFQPRFLSGQDSYSFTIRVVEERTQIGIVNAMVYIEEAERAEVFPTDIQGFCAFPRIFSPGKISITVVKEGYLPKQLRATVSSTEEDNNVTIELQKPQSDEFIIQGHVFDKHDKFVPDAKVVLNIVDYQRSHLSNESGYYYFIVKKTDIKSDKLRISVKVQKCQNTSITSLVPLLTNDLELDLKIQCKSNHQVSKTKQPKKLIESDSLNMKEKKKFNVSLGVGFGIKDRIYNISWGGTPSEICYFTPPATLSFEKGISEKVSLGVSAHIGLSSFPFGILVPADCNTHLHREYVTYWSIYGKLYYHLLSQKSKPLPYVLAGVASIGTVNTTTGSNRIKQTKGGFGLGILGKICIGKNRDFALFSELGFNNLSGHIQLGISFGGQ